MPDQTSNKDSKKRKGHAAQTEYDAAITAGFSHALAQQIEAIAQEQGIDRVEAAQKIEAEIANKGIDNVLARTLENQPKSKEESSGSVAKHQEKQQEQFINKALEQQEKQAKALEALEHEVKTLQEETEKKIETLFRTILFEFKKIFSDKPAGESLTSEEWKTLERYNTVFKKIETDVNDSLKKLGENAPENIEALLHKESDLKDTPNPRNTFIESMKLRMDALRKNNDLKDDKKGPTPFSTKPRPPGSRDA